MAGLIRFMGASGWRRYSYTVLTCLLAAAMLITASVSPVSADPETATDPNAVDSTAAVNTGNVLAYLNEQYNTGAGGGQLSTLINGVMILKAQGFSPSPAQLTAVYEALDNRPNQKPLVIALQDALAYQQKTKAQAALLAQAQAQQNANQAVMGAGQMPSDGAPTAPVFGIGQP